MRRRAARGGLAALSEPDEPANRPPDGGAAAPSESAPRSHAGGASGREKEPPTKWARGPAMRTERRRRRPEVERLVRVHHYHRLDLVGIHAPRRLAEQGYNEC